MAEVNGRLTTSKRKVFLTKVELAYLSSISGTKSYTSDWTRRLGNPMGFNERCGFYSGFIETSRKGHYYHVAKYLLQVYFL